MDAVIIALAHAQFRKMQRDAIKKLMNARPVIVDVRGMLDQDEAGRLGITYLIL
jgi:UDP-N-acetyl-D-mannosaminuronate dehydrogenase